MNEELTRETVVEALDKSATPAVKLVALADSLGLAKAEHAHLRALLLELVEIGVVDLRPGGAFALRPRGRASDTRGPKLSQNQHNIADGSDYEEGEWAAKPPGRGVAKPARRGSKALPHTARPLRAPRPSNSGERPVAKPVGADSAQVAKPLAARSSGMPEGRITVHPAGYGFVTTDTRETIFVPAKYRGASLDGDRVIVTTWQGVKGTEGRVESVVARGRARLTGVLRMAGRTPYLEPDDPRIAADWGHVSLDGATMGRPGDAVVIEITRYPTEVLRQLGGKIIKVLGNPEDPRTEIAKILACAELPLEFPDEVERVAAHTPVELTERDFVDRIDLRAKRFCTIDPETARDFDDALCIEDSPLGGTRVWVAVADVGHYVRWGDPLDREAAIRGVSVYLPDRVIPMLPIQLSAGICSLNPDVDRCAMVVRLDYSAELDLIDVGYAAAVIRSKARLDYPGVAAALQGDFRGRREVYRPWLGELGRFAALAQVLRERRRERGALELELAEPKVVLDADDPLLVRDVVRAKGDAAVKQAYELVEEFMIAANEAVGAFFRKRGHTAVWRVHAPPTAERVAQLAEVLGAYGIYVDEETAATPLGIKAILTQIADKPAAQPLQYLVLRTLTQAAWDIVPVGHFGLASTDYLHFTSPIRRYPDLLVHRLLKHYLHKEGQPSGGGYVKAPPEPALLSELAVASSGFERRAIEAEREAVSMYRAYFMRDQVGEQFPGVINAVTSFGVFVEISAPFVEGLVKLDAIAGDDFDFDDVHMRLRGRRTGRVLALGDSVIVEVINVSVLQRRIELALLSGGQVRPRDEAAVPGTLRQRRKAAAVLARGERSVPQRGPRRGAPAAEPERPAPRASRKTPPGKPQGKKVSGAKPKAKATASGRPRLKVSSSGRGRLTAKGASRKRR